MKLVILLSFAIPSFLCFNAAAEVTKTDSYIKNGWFIEAGGQFSKPSLSHMPANGKAKNSPTYGVFVGVGKYLTEDFALALNLKHLAEAKNEYITEEIQRHTSKIINTVNVHSTIFTLDGIFEANKFAFYNITPYARVGFGVSLNSTQTSKKTFINDAPQDSSFGKESSITTIYKLGFGVTTNVTEKISISLGFEHMNLGKVKIDNFGNKAKLKTNSIIFGTSFKL